VIKFNIDASFHEQSMFGGIGLVVLAHHGSLIRGQAMLFDF
jgi:hypothetical protein